MERYDTLLISSSSAENRAYLRDALGEGFNLLEAVNVPQMLLLLQQNKDCIAALLLDATNLSDADKALLGRKENFPLLHAVQIIVFTENDQTERLNRAFSLGAADVIPIDYDPYAMLHRIENIVLLHLHKWKLETLVEKQAEELRYASSSMVEAMSSIIEYRSVESGQHILRIRRFTQLLLEEVVRSCPEYNLTDRVVSIICSAAALHDIGKIAIPDAVLMKPGKLTAEEMELMKTHTTTGCEILSSLANVAEKEYLSYAYNICRYHHERFDGRGYPEGRSGEDIPICAQVVGLADVYDALTTKRVYKDAVSCAQAVNMILKGECGVFSPKLLECFKNVAHLFEEAARDYADGLPPASENFDVSLPAPNDLQDENSVERIRGKYYALVHYINGFLMEINLDMGVMHVVYNPYPEMAQFHDVRSFGDLAQMIMQDLIHPDDKARIEQLLTVGVKTFLAEGLRRQSDRFRFRSKRTPEGELFDVTFLRINPADSRRRSLAILVCKVEVESGSAPLPQTLTLADAVCFCRNDREFTLLEVDNTLCYLTGYSKEEIMQEYGGCLLRLIHADEQNKVLAELGNQLKQGTNAKLELRLQRKNGSSIWVLCKFHLEVDASGQEYLCTALTDITHFKRANEEQTKQLERYEIILTQTENVLFVWDAATDKIDFSGTWEKIFGYAPGYKKLREQLSEGGHLHPDDLPLLLDGISNIENGSAYQMVEVRIITTKGRYLWCRVRATAIRGRNGELEKISGVIINIDAEKRAEKHLQDRAERDSLTKLLNKEAGRRQAEDYLASYSEGAHSAMLIIDLDNFKYINDRYGHLFGDAVLTQTAREIKKLFRNQDIVTRIGGDEFLVLMRGVSDQKLVESRCQRLLNIFQNSFQDNKVKLELSCSIGIALSPEHGKNYYELFNKADQALYWAKAEGKNSFVFFSEENRKKHARRGVSSAVNNRIDSDEEPGLAEDNLVRYAFQKLYGCKDMEEAVNDILELVGQKLNVSRVYVFENSDDNCFCSNTFEWCNHGITPEIGNLQHISYKDDIDGYKDIYNEQDILYCSDINELPEHIYNILAPQGIKSLLHCAIRDDGVFRGYIGFDECVEYRYWTKEQIQTLTYFSEMLSMYLLKQRKQEKAMRYASELQSILDNQNSWIYIIDPDTCEMKYLNVKTKVLAPEAKTGMCCYRALMGLSERCPGCPALNIRQLKNGSKRIHNSCFDLDVLADATLIQWEGEESCLMTCREMPKDL